MDDIKPDAEPQPPAKPAAAPPVRSEQPAADDSPQPHGHGLFNRGYVALLGTQFFGAANDNLLKGCLTFMIATGIWSGSLAEGGLGEGGQVVPALLLTVPFIFLSGYAGQISDRFSKSRVMFWVKVAEVPIAMVAFLGFYMGSLWITLLAMLLLAVQSSFFGPAKYGVIPELVGDDHLSMANGLINMFTNLAVIIGTLLAGPLCDLYHPKPDEAGVIAESVPWAPGAGMIVLAAAGLAVVVLIPRLKSADPHLKWDLNPFRTYWDCIKIMSKGPLLAVVLAWAGFYMIGMLALMILPEYEQILDVTYTETSYLLGVLGVGIAIGSLITGAVSGSHIRPWLIPFGATGMTVAFLLLGLMPPEYYSVAAMIFLAGFFAGFYIVPLQALIQLLAPDDERGRIIGTSGAISFCFSSLGPAVYWITAQRGMPPNRVFLICAGLALVGTIAGVSQLKKLTAK